MRHPTGYASIRVIRYMPAILTPSPPPRLSALHATKTPPLLTGPALGTVFGLTFPKAEVPASGK